MAAIPSVDGKPSKPFVGVLGCMVSSASRIKDVAREFVENHLLQVESLNVDLAGTPIEWARAWFAGDRVKLTIDHDEHA